MEFNIQLTLSLAGDRTPFCPQQRSAVVTKLNIPRPNMPCWEDYRKPPLYLTREGLIGNETPHTGKPTRQAAGSGTPALKTDQPSESPLLLEQANQLGLLGQEGVMAVGAGHFAVIRLDPRGTNGMSEAPHILRRKKPIRTYTYEA